MFIKKLKKKNKNTSTTFILYTKKEKNFDEYIKESRKYTKITDILEDKNAIAKLKMLAKRNANSSFNEGSQRPNTNSNTNYTYYRNNKNTRPVNTNTNNSTTSNTYNTNSYSSYKKVSGNTSSRTQLKTNTTPFNRLYSSQGHEYSRYSGSSNIGK